MTAHAHCDLLIDVERCVGDAVILTMHDDELLMLSSCRTHGHAAKLASTNEQACRCFHALASHCFLVVIGTKPPMRFAAHVLTGY